MGMDKFQSDAWRNLRKTQRLLLFIVIVMILRWTCSSMFPELFWLKVSRHRFARLEPWATVTRLRPWRRTPAPRQSCWPARWSPWRKRTTPRIGSWPRCMDRRSSCTGSRLMLMPSTTIWINQSGCFGVWSPGDGSGTSSAKIPSAPLQLQLPPLQLPQLRQLWLPTARTARHPRSRRRRRRRLEDIPRAAAVLRGSWPMTLHGGRPETRRQRQQLNRSNSNGQIWGIQMKRPMNRLTICWKVFWWKVSRSIVPWAITMSSSLRLRTVLIGTRHVSRSRRQRSRRGLVDLGSSYAPVPYFVLLGISKVRRFAELSLGSRSLCFFSSKSYGNIFQQFIQETFPLKLTRVSLRDPRCLCKGQAPANPLGASLPAADREVWCCSLVIPSKGMNDRKFIHL